MIKQKKFSWILALVILAIVFLVFQGIYLLMVSPEAIYTSIANEPRLARLMDEQDVSEAQIFGVFRFIAFFWLALGAWFGLVIMKIRTGEKKVFLHLLIPSILAFISGRWEAGICGIIASIIHKKSKKETRSQ